MKCSELERWLDEGMPETSAAAARDHAARCDACARLITAAVEVEALLAAEEVAAPADFTDRLMARVEATPRLEVSTSLPVFIPDPLPWWVRAAGDPATALAFILAGLVAWKLPVLIEAGGWVLDRLGDLAQAAAPSAWSAPPTATGPGNAATVLALTVAFAPILGWVALGLYRASRGLVEQSARVFRSI